MKYANACRRSKGRTGPLGAVGIRERLRQQLGRSPDLDELDDEMRRDKRYPGRSRRKIVSPSSLPESGGDGISEMSERPDSFHILRCPLSPTNTPFVPGTITSFNDEGIDNTDCTNGTERMDGLPRQMDVGPVSLATIVQKQISEIRNSSQGESEDGRSLVSTLEKQLLSMMRRSNSVNTVQGATSTPADPEVCVETEIRRDRDEDAEDAVCAEIIDVNGLIL